MIEDLTIENYRLFRKFEIDGLARVNLIVGDNNSGKSSLLEAVYLLTGKGYRGHILRILQERGEYMEDVDPILKRKTISYRIIHIFHKHEVKVGSIIKIATMSEQASFILSTDDNPEQLALSDLAYVPPSALKIRYTKSGETTEQELKHDEDISILPSARKSSSNVIFVTTNPFGYDELSILWDHITITPKESKVVEALQILEPAVEQIRFVSRQTSNSGIILGLRGQYSPVPLGSMGGGMRRILAIAASLVSAEGGTLLVDEIDTGLYHGAMTNMWRLVLETAARLDVQVFATTHSWDCVESFADALSARDDEIGQLIRLERHGEDVRAVQYSKDLLETAADQRVEVR
ncbi:MAG: AAA family ATPase [Anaerolineae bacterium]|nr:AAA family ATPase [Anaerolineae bacterium]